MLASKLKNLRNSKKYTQSDLAKLLGVARTTYAMYEQGNREPDYETLIKIADHFDVTTDYLLGRTDSRDTVLPKVVPIYERLSIPKEDYEDLSSYQHEVLEWAVQHDVISFSNKKKNVLDMMETLEFAYEANKKIEKK